MFCKETPGTHDKVFLHQFAVEAWRKFHKEHLKTAFFGLEVLGVVVVIHNVAAESFGFVPTIWAIFFALNITINCIV